MKNTPIRPTLIGRLLTGPSLIGLLALALTPVLFTASAIGEGRPARPQVPVGIYIELTEDFYRALNEESTGTRTYSNQAADEYLRQIAVSSKFMVESNLQILKQQERIIQLLEKRQPGSSP